MAKTAYFQLITKTTAGKLYEIVQLIICLRTV